MDTLLLRYIFAKFCLICMIFHADYVYAYSSPEYLSYRDKNVSGFQQNLIDDLVYNNEDMPRPCRTDLCDKMTYRTRRKGTFYWKDTVVGNRVKLLCPFAIEDSVFTERSCMLGDDGVPVWEELNVDICPDPPVAQLLQTLTEEYNGTTSLEFRAETLLRIQKTLDLHIDKPINYTEIQLLVQFSLDVIPHFQQEKEQFSSDVATAFLSIFDILMSNKKYEFESVMMSENTKREVLEQLRNLPLSTAAGNNLGTVNVNCGNFIMVKESVDLSVTKSLNLAKGFTYDNATSPMVWIYFEDLDISDTVEVGVVLVKEMFFFYHGDFTVDDPLDVNSSELATASSTPNSRYPPQFSDLYGTFDPVRGIVLISTTLEQDPQWTEDDVTVVYGMECMNEPCSEWNPQLDDIVCVSSESSSSWQEGTCRKTIGYGESGYQCECTGVGAFGMLFYHQNKQTFVIFHDGGPVYYDDDVEISSFLGFPYHKELDILGKILNALSLICLLATLFSYAFIRKARRGNCTTILLNLCVALVCLSIAFFVVPLLVKSKRGCRAANILRYYLVFVTLLWNTVEAVNMYLMLIKVIGSKISKFPLKAGILAWGIPGLMVGICLAADLKAFDGKHVLLVEYDEFSGDCAFKCQLKDYMLYFGYLLPMCAIIIHNFVIFILVLRVIFRKSQLQGAHKKKSRLVQLIGIAATLVLLGVPWIFSAFGVLDASNNLGLKVIEGIFQVIFVVFVNLQGLFIFVFHCARNVSIRESWTSALSSVTRKTTTTSSCQSSSIHSKRANSKSGENTPKSKEAFSIEPSSP